MRRRFRHDASGHGTRQGVTAASSATIQRRRNRQRQSSVSVKVTGARPPTFAVTVSVPGVEPIVSTTCALPLASVVVVELSTVPPLLTDQVTVAPATGLPY